MSMMPGNPCHKDADFHGVEFEQMCPECKGERFNYDGFIDGTTPLVCDICLGSGIVEKLLTQEKGI